MRLRLVIKFYIIVGCAHIQAHVVSLGHGRDNNQLELLSLIYHVLVLLIKSAKTLVLLLLVQSTRTLMFMLTHKRAMDKIWRNSCTKRECDG